MCKRDAVLYGVAEMSSSEIAHYGVNIRDTIRLVSGA